MKAVLRFAVAATALALAAPALAQEVNASAPAPAAEEVVGPPQLRDFSLNGTVTRQAEPQPERSDSAATGQRPNAASSPRPPQPSQPTRSEAAGVAQPEPQVQRQAASATPQPSTSDRPASLPLPPAGQAFTPAPISGFAAPPPVEAEPAPLAQSLADEGGGMPMLPWALALILFGGGAALYLRRQRSRYALAGGAPGLSELVAPEPAPRPLPPKPPPLPAVSLPAAPVGVVTTRLRPWLDLEFRAERAVIDAEQAVVHFEIVVFNSGSAPARDVLIEAALFNAGPQQDQVIGAFFAKPVGEGDSVPMIPPLKRMAFRSAVHIPRKQLVEFELGGRKLFVPVIGVNANYRWSGGSAQSAASYLVGREGRGDKLAPLQIANGPREIAGLAARELELRIRR